MPRASMTGEADVFLPPALRGRRVEGCLDLLHGQRTASADLEWRLGVAHKVFTESLILAQDERWRRALYMQVERKGPFGGTRAANG